ncbi:MAG: cystathionine gamma-synthase, partial [Streptococcus sp.]|nr:cystathionine gamma-synthase [Streptococcus sp.]
PEVAEATEKKNNYDFLKTSQIYNKDQHKLKPQPIKQELDLTHLDQE